MDNLLETVWQKVSTSTDIEAYEDLKNLCRDQMDIDPETSVLYLRRLWHRIEQVIPSLPDSQLAEFDDLYARTLLAAARHDFESFLIYIDWDKKPQAKFYLPRRTALEPVVEALQELADDKLTLLCISLPPGTGKTTLAIFFLVWLASNIPDKPILTASHSESIVKGMYLEVLSIMRDSAYRYADVFPEILITETKAKEVCINLQDHKRFETLEFTSVGASNAGRYRAMTLLYCDDLIEGRETAMSRDRLDKLWGVFSTDLRQRKQGDVCKELHIATRWSVHDVIGRLEEKYGDNGHSKFICVPAVDENDESNFDYPYGVGFNTEFYRDQREIMDEIDWRALYLNQPIEREGLLYTEDDLQRFYSLPDGEPDAVISVCDTKDRGKDYAVLPVCVVYGQKYYITDCICDNGLPEVLEDRYVDILMRNKVHLCQFESNSAGGVTARNVSNKLKAKKAITSVSSKPTTTNKETKIIANSNWVKENCYFLDSSLYKRSSDYGKMMKFLCSYSLEGKNKHDDVPDAMAMLAQFAQSMQYREVKVIQRPF